MHEAIDFVILWVDGSDPEWLKEKALYSPAGTDYSSGANRFRDFDNLQFFFRGVEKFAPWVRKVFFVTWGHVPKWLNTEHPKLRIVNHRDYIPHEYLPTYNSNTIELNFHRIPDLSEHFVLFNDDMFLLKNVRAEDFFSVGLPRDEFSMNPVLPMGEKFRIAHTIVNNTGVINTHFSKSECFKKNLGKYVNMSYGGDLIRTVLLMPWGCFLGFKNPHLPVSHLKSTFEKVWAEEGEALDRTCRNRFRGYDDLNHWLMRYWNLCEGNFVPRSSSFGKYFNLGESNRAVMEYIVKQKGSMICINDMSEDIDFERAKKEMKWAFRKILPEKSSFER